MKQILAALALIALALSFASCDKTCNCNCSCCNTNGSDQTIQRPDNSGSGSGNNGGTTDDNTGGNTGNTEDYNQTFTQGYAGYYGAFYEEAGQPSNTTNWFVELADDNYDLENYEGTGYNIALEIFASGTSSTSIPSGKYTVETLDENLLMAGTVLYGFIGEDEENGEYPAGTWLYSGNDAIAGATSGWVQIAASGSTYTITYELRDDEYQISFKGSFTGSLAFYDGTQEVTSVSAAKNFAPSKSFHAPKTDNPVRHYRIRK